MIPALALAVLASAAALSAVPTPPSAEAPPPPSPRAAAWWADITAIADDRNEGRQTGSAGYLRAADYVIARFRAEGLAPAGEGGGYTQSVAFEEQAIDAAASRVTLEPVRGGASSSVAVGEDLLISAGGAPRPTAVDAPLVFIGYGLHLPRQGHDDFAGVDLEGRIAVVISSGPADLAGPAKAAARADRARLLGAAGAVGLITLTTPKQLEIPWSRQKLLAQGPGMYLADPRLRETPDGFFLASFDPAASERLFAGSGHSFAELAARADASAPLPSLALPLRLKAAIEATHRGLTSPNLVARLEGADPTLRGQAVVISAHLDHLGVGASIDGDRIYNGAMDDASGVASVLDIAQRLKAGPRPRRSVLFLIVTAEEKGLLGSRFFALRPTPAGRAVVADLNFDMPLPLWPLKTVLAQGEAESSLGDVARATAAAQGLALTPDPLPDRNSFTRTDQFSFVKAGVPSLAFKFGFVKGSPEFQIEHDWRATRYHAPSDDVNQPGVLKEEAVRLDDYVAALALEVADAPARPTWRDSSVFKTTAATP